MTASDLDAALRSADPWTADDADDASPAVAALVAATRADGPTASRAASRRVIRRGALLAPLAVLGGLALTAGALVAADGLLHADLPIPIEYRTDTGRDVACTATIEGGSFFAPREDEVVAYYRSRDFSDVGQRIYDYALVLAGDREPSPDVLPRSSMVVADQDGNPYPDSAAFSLSLTSFLLTDAQLDLGIDGSGDSWLSTDCAGELH